MTFPICIITVSQFYAATSCSNSYLVFHGQFIFPFSLRFYLIFLIWNPFWLPARPPALLTKHIFFKEMIAFKLSIPLPLMYKTFQEIYDDIIKESKHACIFFFFKESLCNYFLSSLAIKPKRQHLYYQLQSYSSIPNSKAK